MPGVFTLGCSTGVNYSVHTLGGVAVVIENGVGFGACILRSGWLVVNEVRGASQLV